MRTRKEEGRGGEKEKGRKEGRKRMKRKNKEKNKHKKGSLYEQQYIQFVGKQTVSSSCQVIDSFSNILLTTSYCWMKTSGKDQVKNFSRIDPKAKSATVSHRP